MEISRAIRSNEHVEAGKYHKTTKINSAQTKSQLAQLTLLHLNQSKVQTSPTIRGEIRKRDGVNEDKNLSAIEPDEVDAFQ